MPHVLRRLDNGDFSVGKAIGIATDDYDEAEWQNREAGNDKNNPFPPFIGKPITDLGRFQERLMMLSGEHCVMSVTNQPTNFFRSTVSQVLDTGPIRMRSTGQQAAKLEKIVDLGNDVLLFSSKGQHRLSGAQAMTPRNAALPRITSYAAQLKSAPDTDGGDVYFAQSHGQYSKMQRFKTGRADVAKTEAFSISDHALQYIEGEIGNIVASESQKMILINALSDSKLYVYEYRENDDGNHSQGSWSDWEFGSGEYAIQHMRMENDLIEMAVTNADDDLIYLTLALFQSDLLLSDRLHLDNKFLETGVTTTVTAPAGWNKGNADLKIVMANDTPLPWGDIGYVDNLDGTYTLDESAEGGTVIVGEVFRSDYVPPRPRVNDKSGKLITQVKLNVTDYDVLLKSGSLFADVEGEFVDPWDTGMDRQHYGIRSN